MIRGVNKLGRSPLQYTACHGFHEAVEHIYKFIDGGSMVNILYGRDRGITPIFEAIKRDNMTLFDFLNKGARVNVKINGPGMRGRFD